MYDITCIVLYMVVNQNTSLAFTPRGPIDDPAPSDFALRLPNEESPVIYNPLQDALRLMDKALTHAEPTGYTPEPIPELTIDELATRAAQDIEPDWHMDEQAMPGDRLPQELEVCDTPDSADVDATAAIQASIDEFDEGSWVHTGPGGTDVRVRVQSPEIYVTDSAGNVIPDAKIMVRFSDIEQDTP